MLHLPHALYFKSGYSRMIGGSTILLCLIKTGRWEFLFNVMVFAHMPLRPAGAVLAWWAQEDFLRLRFLLWRRFQSILSTSTVPAGVTNINIFRLAGRPRTSDALN